MCKEVHPEYDPEKGRPLYTCSFDGNDMETGKQIEDKNVPCPWCLEQYVDHLEKNLKSFVEEARKLAILVLKGAYYGK